MDEVKGCVCMYGAGGGRDPVACRAGACGARRGDVASETSVGVCAPVQCCIDACGQMCVSAGAAGYARACQNGDHLGEGVCAGVEGGLCRLRCMCVLMHVHM